MTLPDCGLLFKCEAGLTRPRPKPPETETEKMTTRNRQQFKNHVSSASTGCDGHNVYYESVGHAYGRIDSKLLDYDHRINPEDWADKTNGIDFSNPDGVRFVVEVWDGYNSHDDDLVCSFYRMPSGRYELTCYIA